MSATFAPPGSDASGRLAELLVSAAEQLSTTSSGPDLAPAGIPVRGGRMNLALLRTMVPAVAEANGATVFVPPNDMDFGRGAVVADPLGAAFGIASVTLEEAAD